MPLYRYDSYSRRGSRVKGTIDATSAQGAKELLRGQGLMPISIDEVRGEPQGFFASLGLFQARVEFKTVILFTKQLGVLLRSGVPLLQAVDLLLEQFEGRFKQILVRVRDGIKAGEPLAKELSNYPKVFSNVYVQLVAAGEASGKLDALLERLTGYLERDEAVRKSVQKALAYPMMMMSFAGIVVVGLLTVLVPRLTGMFTKMGQELPLPTQILIILSDFLINHYIVLGSVLVGSALIFSYWKSTANGKRKFDEILLKLPLISYFSRTKAIVQFTKTLGLLIESGVNLSQALDIVTKIVENSVLTEKLVQAKDKIIKEGKISKYLKQTGIFPNIAIYMIGTGEESGQLGQMLTQVGGDYDQELMELTDGLTEKISPIMTVVMGLIVGLIIISIFLPIMKMGDLSGL